MTETLIVSCPNCETRFKAPAEKFFPDGRQVRCSSCRHVWFHAVESPVTRTLPEGRPEDAASRLSAAEARESAKLRSRRKSASGGVLRWLVWLLLLALLLAVLAYVFRAQISEKVPASTAALSHYGERIDRTLGIHAGNSRSGTARTFEVEDSRFDIKTTNGIPVVLVEAKARNATDASAPAPDLRIRLVNDDRKVLSEIITGPRGAAEDIAPGESARYFARVNKPSQSFSDILVDIAPDA